MSENDVKKYDEEKEQNRDGRKTKHRRMKPWVKWTLIGVGGVIVIGGVAYLIINGKKVPAKAITKGAEVVADVATVV